MENKHQLRTRPPRNLKTIITVFFMQLNLKPIMSSVDDIRLQEKYLELDRCVCALYISDLHFFIHFYVMLC